MNIFDLGLGRIFFCRSNKIQNLLIGRLWLGHRKSVQEQAKADSGFDPSSSGWPLQRQGAVLLRFHQTDLLTHSKTDCNESGPLVVDIWAGYFLGKTSVQQKDHLNFSFECLHFFQLVCNRLGDCIFNSMIYATGLSQWPRTVQERIRFANPWTLIFFSNMAEISNIRPKSRWHVDFAMIMLNKPE